MKFMFFRLPKIGAYTAITALMIGSMVGINAVSAAPTATEGKACYEQFSAAKKAGSLKEKNFKEYKTVHCVDKAAESSQATTSKEVDKGKTTSVEKSATAPVVSGDIVFPDKVDTKYAQEKDGTARMHTCRDQYKVNKATNKNGGLKWIQKGGGYYSECMKHLKGQASK
ncbi:hypothetical protein [Commensalibacter oyaizuii]|uniref:Uncharacterized protein n=1 Tax=Commensalibacter oyaizuii TaxID=3043873 RepID=A0ABT6Q3F5_9PROT|nr:hypothetical protein [Commensalibacter sp. TBRC 16381]MDI2091654.1 hypothetical protein [Commensalibacter sp. TBRC 16381]